jgi:anthranilate synthase component 2
LIKTVAGKIPVLGVCLGHQAIGQAFGGKVVRAPAPLHGKLSQVTHRGAGLFQEVPSPLTGTRYHSLVVDRATLPDCFEITAETTDGLIMGLQHRQLPLHGVQFHPESIASEHGHRLLGNFLRLAGHNMPSSKAA